MIVTSSSRSLGFVRSMFFYKVVMAILILGLSFIPCRSSKLNGEESVMMFQLHRQGSSVHSLVYTSGRDDTIRTQRDPAIKGQLPASFTGNRRMLGENFAEQNVMEDEKRFFRTDNRFNIKGSGHENKMERPDHHHHHRRRHRRQASHEAISFQLKKRILQVSGSTTVTVHEESSKTESNSLAAKKTNTVPWHKPGEKYDEPTFHVDYSGPKTHPPKNN